MLAAPPSLLSTGSFPSVGVTHTHNLAIVSPIFKKDFTRFFIPFQLSDHFSASLSRKNISKELPMLCLQFFTSLKPPLYLQDSFGIKQQKTLSQLCQIKWRFMSLNNKNPPPPPGRVGSGHGLWLCFGAIILALSSSLALTLSSGFYQDGFQDRTKCHM